MEIVLTALLVGFPPLIGLINRSAEAFAVGLFFVLVAIGALALHPVAGGAAWVLGVLLALGAANRTSRRRDEERRHRELLATMGGSPSAPGRRRGWLR